MSRLNFIDPYESILPTSTESSHKDQLLSLPIKDVLSLKTDIEARIEQLSTHLQDHLKSDMNESLVTGDGFPRMDKDVVDVRYTRVAVLKYRNDLKIVVDVIADRLDELFTGGNNVESGKVEKSNDNDNDVEVEKVREAVEEYVVLDNNGDVVELVVFNPQVHGIPFLKVDEVLINSPAHQSGLQKHDEIIKFKELTVLNELREIYGSVNENQLIPLLVKRDDLVLQIELLPKKWNGMGLLGFKMSRL